ncbi:gfo/Idh/MocA family oxidoreductase [Sphingomonas gilva]|uniref:Gfo/Idh/MocA family oxidoreductase n=1 Tax=Sphingomonas gilva TaxID=2305907 RepID=A0A396RQI6_9SPHN|nr:Gfo/Idh/MocA family oxidoreductase [Sphingomonas gilva]RHW17542.1 gfo/Idh/MocA family oxidoreductase [Sphingomonas gilva]
MSRPRVGFLGTGWIGRNRMAAILATGLVEPAFICDPDPACVAEARALAPQALVVEDFDAMLGGRPDGVVIATPSAQHAAQSSRALAAGVAVFCQKPLGRSAAEVREVVEMARRADRLLAVDLSYRATRAVEAIRALVQSGELGGIYAADLTFHNAYGPDKPWFYDRAQSGGGCVIDLGVHLVDLALHVLDFPDVVGVSSHLFAQGRPLVGDGVEDYATAELTLATGAVVRLACSWRLHAGRDAVIEAVFRGADGAAALGNVDGSFYDFAVDRLDGTAARRIVAPPDDWGGRAAARWAQALSRANRFDPEAERYGAVAGILDRIYQSRAAY